MKIIDNSINKFFNIQYLDGTIYNKERIISIKNGLVVLDGGDGIYEFDFYKNWIYNLLKGDYSYLISLEKFYEENYKELKKLRIVLKTKINFKGIDGFGRRVNYESFMEQFEIFLIDWVESNRLSIDKTYLNLLEECENIFMKYEVCKKEIKVSFKRKSFLSLYIIDGRF
jgi:hypothetical protein